MNIFGFFAVIIACITVVVTVIIICKRGFTITHLHKDITERPTQPEKNPIGFSNNRDELEKELNKKSDEVLNMDAVIKAANELMGIEVNQEVKDEQD